MQDEPEAGISMEDGKGLSLEQIRPLAEASEQVQFQSQDREELYDWVTDAAPAGLRPAKSWGQGLTRRYLAKMTGLSRAQTARLIRCCQGGGAVKPRAVSADRFGKRADTEVLAAVAKPTKR